MLSIIPRFLTLISSNKLWFPPSGDEAGLYFTTYGGKGNPTWQIHDLKRSWLQRVVFMMEKETPMKCETVLEHVGTKGELAISVVGGNAVHSSTGSE
jgi:hypothetical protein